MSSTTKKPLGNAARDSRSVRFARGLALGALFGAAIVGVLRHRARRDGAVEIGDDQDGARPRA